MAKTSENKLNLHLVSHLSGKSKGKNSAKRGAQADRTPLVMLHGWGRASEMFKDLAPLLSDDFEVHLIDLPGHGKSDMPHGVWGVADFARAITEQLRDLGFSKYVLIGHSFGGKTAIKIASMHPELLDRLVLINSSGLRPQRGLKKQIYFWLLGQFRSLIKMTDKMLNMNIFESWFVPRFASADYLNAGELKNTFVKSMKEELSSDAEKIKCRTLLLWGEKDSETPLYMGRALNTLIENSELVVLKGKGHEPFAGAGAHLVAMHLKRFLEIDDDARSREEEIKSA